MLWDDGELRQRRTWEDTGAALRVIRREEEVAEDHSPDLSPRGLHALADHACASLEPSKEIRPIIELGEVWEPRSLPRAYPHEVKMADRSARVRAVGQAILESAGPGIAQATVKYRDYTQEVVIANSVVQSYLVEEDKIAAPLQSFALTGRPLDVLPHVSQIADDGVPAIGMCGLPESGVLPYGDSQPGIRVERGLRILGPLDLGPMLPALLEG